MAKDVQYCEDWNGTPIDIDSDDWGEFKDVLNKRQKLFCFWLTMPFQEAHNNVFVAALKAGYARKSAYTAKTKLIKKFPAIRALIDKLESQNKKIGLKAVANQLMDQKVKRATYNIKDYIEIREIENPETGETREITAIKPITELTRDQASIIDNININNSGICTYALPSREKETNDLIKYAAEENKENVADGYDVETTVDMVKEQLATVKTTVRFNNQKVKENAQNYIENSENLPKFD